MVLTMKTRNTVERAFDLARSAGVQDLAELRQVLKSEGYEAVEGHLGGLAIRKQLRAIMAEAVGEHATGHSSDNRSAA